MMKARTGRKIPLALAAISVLALLAFAQGPGNRYQISQSGAPSGTCSDGYYYFDVATKNWFVCTTNVWVSATALFASSANAPLSLVNGVLNLSSPVEVTQSVAANLNATVTVATALPAGGNIIGALAANQSINVTQFGGTNVSTGTGPGGAGIPRVTISNDSSLAANQSVNANQIGGSAIGIAAAGVQKVGVVGNANGAFDAANNATPPANVLVEGFEAATQTSTQPTAATPGNVRRAITRTDGALYVAPHGPVIWSCGLNAIGATLTQCQAAPGVGLRLYITDITSQSNTTTSGLFTLRFGTGTNCGTGTGNIFFSSASALIANGANTLNVPGIHFVSPLAVTANNAICVLGVATNTTNIQINGYTAP